MKKIIFIFSIFALFSCNKNEIDTLGDSTIKDINLRNNPKGVNGLLSLNSHSEYYEIIKVLKQSESTQAKRNALYSDLGIDRSDELNDTDHPACMKFELENNYVSLRSYEEDTLFDELDGGNENLNGIISDPYFKTIINADRSVKVGNRIYKSFDSQLTAIIANNDFSTYNSIKQLNQSDVRNGFNVRLLGTTTHSLDKYFNRSVNNKIIDDKAIKDILVNQIYNSETDVTLLNNSFVEYQDKTKPIFTWIYPDGSTETTDQTNRKFSVGDKIILTVGNNTNPTDTTIINIRSCIIDGATALQVNGRTYHFTLPENPESAYEIKWNMGNGDIRYGRFVAYTYPEAFDLCEMEVTIQALRSNGSVACEDTFPLFYIPDECDKKGDVTD